MVLLGALRDWLVELRTQRARTISTLMGIAWGTFGVVGILAFGRGLEDRMRERAAGLGEGIVITWGQRTSMPFAGFPEGRRVQVTEDDVLALREIPEIGAVSPEYITSAPVQRGDAVYRTTLCGVRPAFAGLRSIRAQPGGRFLNERDVDEARRVMFLGDLTKRQLFGEREAVGETLVLFDEPFTVVGVLEPKDQDSDYDGKDERRVFLPSTTFARVFGARYVDDFVFAAEKRPLTDAAIDAVYATLGRRLQFDPTDREALNTWDTTEDDEIRDVAFLAMNALITLACVCTLLVGGIGVGNLMFLLVQRRTHEIGIRMALGARPRWILQEVLLQAFLLVVVGGVAGFGGAVLLAKAIALSPWTDTIGTPRISLEIGVGTVVLLALIGLAAGWFPARRASRLDPVRALAD